MEYFTMRETENGYALSGTIICRLEKKPAKIEYLVLCDPKFHTRQAGIYQIWGDESRTMQITVDAGKKWHANNVTVEGVDGLQDIDLSVTPATNTFILRRMNIAVGRSFETTSAWLSLPSLRLVPLTQKYTRLSATEYAYEAPSLSFGGRITVDESHLVVNYNDLWQRV